VSGSVAGSSCRKMPGTVEKWKWDSESNCGGGGGMVILRGGKSEFEAQ
jgi:hypothetical protein